MNNFNPVFRSPITSGSTSTAQASALTLTDLTGVPVVLIQGEVTATLKAHFAQIPAQPGDVVAISDGLLARLTPAEFYAFGLFPKAKLPAAAALDDSLAKGQHFAHATDYTHGKAVVRLAGAPAPELLSKICGLDFDNQIFPSGRVAQTSAAKIKTLIARSDTDQTPTYYLHVNRPLGQYFWEIVWDSGQEFGLTTMDS